MVRPRQFNEEEVLKKAMETFWLKGYEATSLNDLMQVTGLSKSSLYETFGSKHDFFIKAFRLYQNERMEGLRQYLNHENVYLGIEMSFKALLNNDHNKLGCMTSNEAIELAPHDKQFQQIVESDFNNVEQAFFEAIERGKNNGTLNTLIESLKLARFLTISLQGINVMLRSQTKHEKIEDAISVILNMLHE
jgi:TetR/AcrR family transcriptional repressor of nem operon